MSGQSVLLEYLPFCAGIYGTLKALWETNREDSKAVAHFSSPSRRYCWIMSALNWLCLLPQRPLVGLERSENGLCCSFVSCSAHFITAFSQVSWDISGSRGFPRSFTVRQQLPGALRRVLISGRPRDAPGRGWARRGRLCGRPEALWASTGLGRIEMLCGCSQPGLAAVSRCCFPGLVRAGAAAALSRTGGCGARCPWGARPRGPARLSLRQHGREGGKGRFSVLLGRE